MCSLSETYSNYCFASDYGEIITLKFDTNHLKLCHRK